MENKVHGDFRRLLLFQIISHTLSKFNYALHGECFEFLHSQQDRVDVSPLQKSVPPENNAPVRPCESPPTIQGSHPSNQQPAQQSVLHWKSNNAIASCAA